MGAARAVAQELQHMGRLSLEVICHALYSPLALLDDPPRDDAQLRTRVEHLAMPWASETVRVTVSIGGHARIPDDAAGAQAMVDVADQAMYAAKRAGRNCTKLLDAPLPQAAGAALAAV